MFSGLKCTDLPNLYYLPLSLFQAQHFNTWWGLEKRVTTRGQTQRKEIRFREWKKEVRKKGDRIEVNENRKLELNK